MLRESVVTKEFLAPSTLCSLQVVVDTAGYRCEQLSTNKAALEQLVALTALHPGMLVEPVIKGRHHLDLPQGQRTPRASQLLSHPLQGDVRREHLGLLLTHALKEHTRQHQLVLVLLQQEGNRILFLCV